jgi:pimeloyl-ACP methyl ester carboxylesterase
MARRKVVLSRERPARRRAAARANDDYGATAFPDWRGIDWREHLSVAEIGGRRVNYVDIGPRDSEREPLVLIHGLSGRWTNWLENIPFFARERRVIALDLPGFGDSEMPAERITISGYGRCVDALCERLELGPVAIAGNSMGGFTGAEVAIAFPQRVERLCLVSAAGVSIVHLRREPTMAAARIIAALGAMSAAQRERILRRPALRHAAFAFVFRHPTRLRADLLYEQLMGAGKKGFVQALDALTSYDFVDRLPEIGCPTLVVWGRNDMLVPVRDADEFERLIPDARKVVLDDTGHCAMLERPVAFNEQLHAFLEERGQASEQEPVEAPEAA